MDGSAASAVRRAGSDPTAGAGCAYQHRPAEDRPPPIPFEGGVGGTEKLKASSVEPECLGSYAVCGCSCAHAVLHNNRRTLSSDAKLDDASFFRRVDGSAASAVRRAGSDPTAGAGCAYQHRPAHTAPPSAGSPDHSEEHARRSAAAPSTA